MLRLIARLVLWNLAAYALEAAMPDPDPDPDSIAAAEADITGALAELREARANHDHSPNSDSEYWVEQAERRLDVVMDRYKRMRSAEDTADQLVRS